MKNITPTKALLFLLFIFIASYTIYQSINIASGPKINLTSLANGTTVKNPLVLVAGQAKRIAYLSLDDNPIFTDENGQFKEKLLLAPGYNIIKLHAEDRFHRVVEQTLQIMYQ